MIASPRRRLLAVVVDRAAGFVALGGVIVIAVTISRRVPWIQRKLLAVGLRAPTPRSLAAQRQRWRRVFWPLWPVFIANAVLGRNRRGPGARIAGIRRVDGRTGGPVTGRSALIRFAVGRAVPRLIASLYRPQQRRAVERMRAVASAEREIARQHRDAEERQQEALTAFYREYGGTPMSSRVWPFIGILIPQMIPLVPTLWSPRRQTVYDWLSGTVVVDNN
jgi:hypothetical protein